MRALRIDHVTVGGPDLGALERAFRGLGLSPRYGGAHSNGITHMSLVSFDDGSYLELIAPQDARTPPLLWSEHILHGGGFCAWAVQEDDLRTETGRIAALGIEIDGPSSYYRRRPDGVVAEWDLTFVGDGSPGKVLPFLIADRTPRTHRVPPPASGAPRSVDSVVIAVKDLDKSAALFRRVYGWPAPSVIDDAAFDARLAFFSRTPVTLAAPLSASGRIAERLARFGESPCAAVLNTARVGDWPAPMPLSAAVPWLDRTVVWCDLPDMGVRLGIIRPLSASPAGAPSSAR